MKRKLEARLENELVDKIYNEFDMICRPGTYDFEFGKVWHTRKTAHILAKFNQQRQLKEIKDLDNPKWRWF